MEVESFEYDADSGWSVDSFPEVDDRPTLVLVFGSRTFVDDDEPVQELFAAYPDASFAGCSSSGEIHGSKISDDTLSVSVAQFEQGEVATATASITSMDESEATGRQLAEEIDGNDLTGVLVLSKGLEVNGTALANGLTDYLDDSVIVTGGLAGDRDRFEKTWVLGPEGPDPDTIGVVGFYGDAIVLSHGSQGGWDQFGPTRTVTKSDGNVLYELDGRPALELYKRYLGDQADDLPASALHFPLEIIPPDEPDEQLVRTILGIDEDEQSMTFAGDVPEGSKAKLMKVNFHRLLEGASQAAEHSATMSDHDPDASDVLGVAISCVGRRLVLKERTEEELEAVHENLPEGTDLVGFYSYGELSPYVEGEPCALHNQTMTLTVISERA